MIEMSGNLISCAVFLAWLFSQSDEKKLYSKHFFNHTLLHGRCQTLMALKYRSFFFSHI